jgi:hypothetical protein
MTPRLDVLALQPKRDEVSSCAEKVTLGSISLRSIRIGGSGDDRYSARRADFATWNLRNSPVPVSLELDMSCSTLPTS